MARTRRQRDVPPPLPPLRPTRPGPLRRRSRGGMRMPARPLFRADHVGSLLRPARLREAFRQHREGLVGEAEFARIQDEAIRSAVAMQEAVGLHAVTDGEFRRSSYWAHFVDAVDGLEVAPALFEFSDASGRRMAFTAPSGTGEIRRTRPISGAEFRFLRDATPRTPKITMPSPSTMHFWRGPAGIAGTPYASAAEFLTEVAAVYREEIAELTALGATYLQLDEVALAMLCDPDVQEAVTARGEDPGELVGLYVEAIHQALRDRPADTTAAIHLCRGNYKGRWMAAGGYEAVAQRLFGGSGVDVFFLEFDSPRAGDFAPLRHVPSDVGVLLGLVSSKTPQLESRGEILDRIDAASRHMPVERLGLSPQCGFASTAAGNPLTEEDQKRKLALVVEVADEVWL
ncbi:MAG: 5-methyltetrahydropteroyltriglutamate--homocysteine S-methyltransferase [Streptosporangiales bacterium]|nr:5-methyltetrahydropteroyltriglutamate--homocysteine S-methyltransferase [Streptosporangiales bacterium]